MNKKVFIWILRICMVLFMISYVLLGLAFTFHFPTMMIGINSILNGEREINKICRIIKHNSSSEIETMHNLANWICDNIEYNDYNYYRFHDKIIYRKNNPDAKFSIIIKKGACEEYAVLFKYMAKKLDILSRIIYNIGEEHVWNEVFLDNEWIRFDVGLSEDKRFNDTRYDEIVRGKNLSYVYTYNEKNKKFDITEKYTDTGILIIDTTKLNWPIFGIEVTLQSKSLMEWKPDQYDKPKTFLTLFINKKGINKMHLGGNNYHVICKWGLLRNNVKEYDIKIIENYNTTLILNTN